MEDEREIKEDPSFNPMHIEDFQDEKKCQERGAPHLYELAKSEFKQQNMTAWRPIPTLCYSVGIFVAISIVCFAFGIPLLILSADIKEVKQRYDDVCTTYGQKCDITINIEKEMQGEVQLYYHLDNFYQNHRIYMKSYSFEQLQGNYLSAGSLDSCKPAVYMSDIGYSTNPTGVPNYATLVAQNAVAYPCGLIAKSMFNDSYSLTDPNGKSIPINEKGIAWEDDRSLYKDADLSRQWISVENEHFIVWMQTAGLPSFRKRWGRIEQDLKPGKYVLSIMNNYDMRKFEGEKSIILSTTNAFGGKNYILGGFFIGVGGLSMLLCIVFLIGYKAKQFKEVSVVNN